MSKTNSDKQACPYCDPTLLDRILAPTPQDSVIEYRPMIRRFGSHWVKGKKFKKFRPPKGALYGIVGLAPDPRFYVTLSKPEVKRGKYRIKTVTDEFFIPRYAGFKVEIVGVDSKTEMPKPSGAFLSSQRTEDEDGKPEKFVYYMAARISHKDSTLKIEVHSHPSHGRLVMVRGFAGHQNTSEELEIIGKAFEFYRRETRGPKEKMDWEALRQAIQKRGEGATQAQIAKDLGVTPRLLQRHIAASELKGWDAAKRHFLGQELYPSVIEYGEREAI